MSAPAAVTEHYSLGGVNTVLGAKVQDQGVGRAGSPEASPRPAAEISPWLGPPWEYFPGASSSSGKDRVLLD